MSLSENGSLHQVLQSQLGNRASFCLDHLKVLRSLVRSSVASGLEEIWIQRVIGESCIDAISLGFHCARGSVCLLGSLRVSKCSCKLSILCLCSETCLESLKCSYRVRQASLLDLVWVADPSWASLAPNWQRRLGTMLEACFCTFLSYSSYQGNPIRLTTLSLYRQD